MSIELAAVCKAYGSRTVLRDLSFRVDAGEVYGLLGPNGAGKTTAINILCGLLEADSGTARVGGEALNRDRRRSIGVVPQEISLYRDLTCRENLRHVADLYGFGHRDGAGRIETVLERLQLTGYADTRVEALSGGWLRRVNLAASVLHGPRALVLDEPTAGLDVEARHELWTLLQGLQADEVAILLTTHQLDEAERLCSRVGILHEGRIAAEGSLAQLRSTIAAVRLAEVRTDDESALRARVDSLGWTLRLYGGRPTLWLPRSMDLPELVDALEGCGLLGVTMREVGLEEVYLEVTDGASGAGRRAARSSCQGEGHEKVGVPAGGQDGRRR